MKGIIGAIAGDVIGSAYEFNPTRDYNFELFTPKSTFTDDTVLTMANALWLLEDEQHTHERLVEIMLNLCNRYQDRGYGGRFARWISAKDPQPYNSFGNGSAMRVSPVGYYAQTLDDALSLAKISSEVTHNHPWPVRARARPILRIMWLRLSAITSIAPWRKSVPITPSMRLASAQSPRH